MNFDQNNFNIQNSQIKGVYNKKKSIYKIAPIITMVLVILSVVVLISGVMIGVGSGYDNPHSTFSFEPFAYAFLGIFGFAILFNIIIAIFYVVDSLKKKKN